MKSITLMRWSIMVMMVLVVMASPAAGGQVLSNIKDSAALNVGYVPDEEPFSFKGPDNQPVGYAVDIVGIVAGKIQQELSLPNLQVKYSAVSLADGLKMVSDGQYRSAVRCCFRYTSATQECFFLPAYLHIRGRRIVAQEFSPGSGASTQRRKAHSGPYLARNVNRGLAKHTYAVHGGTVTEEWVRDKIKDLGVIATVVTVDDHAEGVEMVVNKKADAYFADRVILENYASQVQRLRQADGT